MKRMILVSTPGNGKTYEFSVDSGVKVGAARRAVVREIMAFEDGKIYLDERTTVLCSKKHNDRRRDNSFLFEGVYTEDCEFLLV